jgi:hypothetical protein
MMMPRFTIEQTFMVPHSRRRTYDARDLDDALRQAAADDDWEDQSKDYDGSTDAKFTGAWRGDLAYVGPDLLATGKRPERCGYCGERKTVAEETWQQWRCGACGSWNDKPQPGGEPVEVLGRAAAFIAERGERELAAAVRRAFEAIVASPKGERA